MLKVELIGQTRHFSVTDQDSGEEFSVAQFSDENSEGYNWEVVKVVGGCEVYTEKRSELIKAVLDYLERRDK